MMDRFLNMLGLCSRAGKCLFGETACMSGIRTGKVFLVLIDQEASANTRKRYVDACEYRKVPYLLVREAAFAAAGKQGRRAIAIADENFARILIQLQASTFEMKTGVEE